MKLDRDEARRRLMAQPVARLATVRPDRAPHAVPICFAVIGDTVYSAVDDKPKTSTNLQRLTNIEANAAACVLADHYDDDWSTLWWVRADGTARTALAEREREQAVAALRAKYAHYQTHRLDGWILAIDITAWSGWAASGVLDAHGTAPDGTAAGGH